jgi:hypothetical protein
MPGTGSRRTEKKPGRSPAPAMVDDAAAIEPEADRERAQPFVAAGAEKGVNVTARQLARTVNLT